MFLITQLAINYGFLIAGTGEFWVDNVKITEVDKTVPVTNMTFHVLSSILLRLTWILRSEMIDVYTIQ